MKQLVMVSYTKGRLDEEKVLRIAGKLTRKQLKQYIRGIRQQEKKTTVVIETAINNIETYKKEFEERFAGKNLIFTKNPTLLLGVRVINNDSVYELSLRRTLSDMQKHIETV